jgi:succinate-semialdehyde dehydrogenase/glutarate-semialdehyde dehydrogenase
LSLLTFREVEDVVKEANSTEFGLASYVFGTNLQHVLNISETLEAGTVCVNGPHYNVTLPHGGMKESGVGKDCSTYSLEEYYYIKRISIRK